MALFSARQSIWVLLLLAMPKVTQADVIVGVAANFLGPAQEIAQQFGNEHALEVKIVSGSSGKLAAMILQGAPIDVFLSADQDRPRKLSEAGLVAASAPYALGRVAAYMPNAKNPLARLMSGSFSRLAIAEPRLAPYGRAAEQVIEALDLGSEIGGKRVIGENIGQSFGFVATGNADIGIVALSQLTELGIDGSESVHVLDSDLHEPIVQQAVLLSRADDNPDARTFFENLASASSDEIILKFGYEVPAR